jgi:hypothetical protein
MTGKTIKIISVAASLVGAVAGLASGWAAEKQQKVQIAEEVAKALAEKAKND